MKIKVELVNYYLRPVKISFNKKREYKLDNYLQTITN